MKQVLLSEEMLKMTYGWTLGACLFLPLIATAGCSHIGRDVENLPADRSAIGGDMPQEKIFDTGRVKINYLDSGSPSGGPLVMLHGGAWRWQEYLSLIPSLSQRWHVYAMDLRGNGRSEWVPGHYRLEDFSGDIETFLRQLDEPAVLVGHSLGGAVALMAAAHCPDKVKAIIIEDAPLDLDNYRKIVDSSREMFDLWLDLKRSASSEQELSLALADRYQDYPGVTSQWILFFAGCLWALDPTYFDPLLHDFDSFAAGYGTEEIMANIKCPVLFIRGERELGGLMADEEISRLTRDFSNVSYVQISGVGHLLHLEDRGQAQVLNEMTAFLSRIPK